VRARACPPTTLHFVLATCGRGLGVALGQLRREEVETGMFSVTQAWKTTYPGALAGVLAMRNVANPEHHPALDALRADLERQLRARFADREELRALEPLPAYKAYFRRFKKTYHVQMQLESVALKGKSIPRVAALVEAMFIAELKNLLLTAGHDLEVVQPPIRLDVATGAEQYLRINGQEQVLKAGDMYIADAEGILSSVIYGPDKRTRIGPATRKVLFTVYAPPGIEEQAVYQHLQDMEANVRLVAPEAETDLLNVYSAS
jgi:DNA/RNA-binding domain of Phe-tRNA-synthetase-like protein